MGAGDGLRLTLRAELLLLLAFVALGGDDVEEGQTR